MADLEKVPDTFSLLEEDLYTTNFGQLQSTDIEKIFFGEIDSKGRIGLDYFTNFAHPSVQYDPFHYMLMYMSTQKLRTPKGLGLLALKTKTSERDGILRRMLQLRYLYSAIWTEAVWLIADASRSNTKFIISDHPVTVYNRACPPDSEWCLGYNDPDIWLQATHTIFPLSLEKVLIFTNLSWVRNPYQSEVKLRPNPRPMRSAIFKYTDIQTLRHLSEQEVQETNYIIKSRALRYIAAGEQDWLYPERSLQNPEWEMFGNGYLLMPDPRAVHLGGQIMFGNKDGTGGAYDEYGRPGWHRDYNKEGTSEGDTLYYFKGEFAKLFGPYRRGRTFEAMQLDKERDGDEFHNYHLGLMQGKTVRKQWKSPPSKIGRNDPCDCESGLKWKKCGYLLTDLHKEHMSKFIDVR